MNGVETRPDPTTLRQALACFPSGVTAVCALRDGSPVGMAANSFSSVSLEPPLVSVCFSRTSATWPLLRRHPSIGISVLGEHQESACRALSAKQGDRFAGVEWTARDDGAVLIEGAALQLDCRLREEVDAGDHVIALLRVLGVRVFPDIRPLVFHGSTFRRLAVAAGAT